MEDEIVFVRQLDEVTKKHVSRSTENINANKVSTRFEIEKIIKIHSNPKNMVILEPADNCVIISDRCLTEIFTYVPICERPKLALVSNRWKRVLDDSCFKVKKLELI